MKVFALALLASSSLVACAQEPASSGPQGKLEVQVSPLHLPGITDACYTIWVTNETGQTVWSQEGVCADRYGDSLGSVSYVGTCDADDDSDSDQASTNTVHLILEGLSDEGGAVDPREYVNPCGDANSETPSAYDGFDACTKALPCIENADVAVTFNITVMRNASQGFFDIAVNFNDVFCSAKLDCAYPATETAPARPIELLFSHEYALDDGGGIQWGDGEQPLTTGKLVRAWSPVLALACTPGAQTDPVIFHSGVIVTCDNGSPDNASDDRRIGLPLTDGFGDAIDGNAFPTPINGGFIYQYAVYAGRELLTQGGDGETDLSKLYWNVAVGLDPRFLYQEGETCWLDAWATATEDNGFMVGGPGWHIPSTDVYPFVRWHVPVVNSGGTRLCSQHPLNSNQEGHGGVTTEYTSPTLDLDMYLFPDWFALARQSDVVDPNANRSPCFSFSLASEVDTSGTWTGLNDCNGSIANE